MNKDEQIMAEVAGVSGGGTMNLNGALVAALLEIENPHFDSVNPHFNNAFASLKAVREAVIPIMAKHGIALIQELRPGDGGVLCFTHLLHVSGEERTLGPFFVPCAANAHSTVGASTYARRVSLMTVSTTVGDVDDDGNAASESPFKSKKEQTQYHTGMAKAWAAKDGPGLRQLWDELDTEQQKFIWHDFNSTQRREMKALLAETKPEVTE